MPATLNAIEMDGMIDEQSRLVLSEPLPILGPRRVRVIVLLPNVTEPLEQEWLDDMARNPAFDFLKDPAEDVYSPTDGKPYSG